MSSDAEIREQLIGRRPPCGRCSFHEGDGKVDANAVACQDNPTVRRADARPPPEVARREAGTIVAAQDLFVNDPRLCRFAEEFVESVEHSVVEVRVALG